MSTISSLIAELSAKLTPPSIEQLRRLVASPEAEALIRRDEAEMVAARKLDHDELRALDTRYADEQAKAGARANARAKEMDEAGTRFRAARDAYADACRLARAVTLKEENARYEIECRLRESADTRLADLARHAADLESIANACFASRPVARRHWMTKELTVETVTNRDIVQPARDALKALEADARRMQLLPLSTVDVTEWIQAQLLTLRPFLSALDERLTLELDEHGALTRDRSVSRRLLINSTIRAHGGTADVPDEIESSPIPAPPNRLANAVRL